MGWAALSLAALLTAPASAADGIIEINHAKALAGGVSAGDTPGYPVTVSASGSYLLTGNLTAPANTNAIGVSADEVTLDLNGFLIQGPVSCTLDKGWDCTPSTSIGIDLQGKGSTVRNGSIVGFNTAVVAGGASGKLLQLSIRQFENGVVSNAPPPLRPPRWPW